ncbi:MAG: bifunctional 5,10-methylene-tetrahydrofolate dehydrogenase/5,10-methylene-tetrahydrofolate cyclohydrolase [Firmicutes bacterium]|nr:bifunctional 5,10-methylene-tetrahydrofolate dehydrogenase/5,10-methylene-tetrahydrofolate cyclohydrolase [Bacillota bacterium]
MAELLKGKAVADALTEKNIETVGRLREAGVEPVLAIVRIGENPSDLSYERGALKRAEKTGVTVKQFIYDETIDQESFLNEIEKINDDDSIHGVLIFRPLPKHISDEAVRNTLVPEKDVDGITDGSLAGIFTGSHRGFAPCTARACMEIAAHSGIDFTGKKVAVLGRSLVIGKPVAMMAMEQNATVTTCHSRTGADEMKIICRESDIIIAAMGRAKMVDAEYAGEDQVFLDVGINVDENGNLCGDVDFEAVEPNAAMITPVPGGVGAITTAVLMLQTLEAAQRTVK